MACLPILPEDLDVYAPDGFRLALHLAIIDVLSVGVAVMRGLPQGG
jgi:hypothetical protein